MRLSVDAKGKRRFHFPSLRELLVIDCTFRPVCHRHGKYFVLFALSSFLFNFFFSQGKCKRRIFINEVLMAPFEG